jgi:multidrug efflux pump subunit AcrB
MKNLEKGFFAFWVMRYKVTYLIAFVIIVFGLISLNNIPKESSPEVNLPLLTITTKYDWVSAIIIDDEITEEIENSIADIEWINSIDSTSSEWNSSIKINVSDWYDIFEVLSEIEDAVDSTNLPSWVGSDYPKVEQRSFTSTDMFSVILYAPEKDFNFEKLLDISEVLKQNTSWKSWVKEVTIDTNTLYDIRIIVSKEKIDNLWISIDTIKSSINNNNIDSPIWTYEIDWKDYSFKLSWKIKDYNDILDLDIFIWDSFKKIKDIAEIELYYGKEKINKFWQYWETGFLYISLTYSKLAWSNIFDVAPIAKKAIEEELEKSLYDGIKFYYNRDESQDITDDFSELTKSALTTLVFVFLALVFFVWFRESVIATIILPLAFLLSFIVVDYLWETLNQMTTFAFVLSFWIAIDTIIIIVEWASEKIRQWYNSRTSVLIALKEYKSPIIIGTITTVSAFIPILTLPWIMWIFLSYIPLVVFITLICTLIVSLTIAWAMFAWLSKNKKTYEVFEEREKVMTIEEKDLLTRERLWKVELSENNKSLREKIYSKYSNFYKKTLKIALKNGYSRALSTIAPVILLIICIVTLVPNLWFELFPSGKNDSMGLTITGPENYTPSDMEEEIKNIEESFSSKKEVKDYTLSISDNKITAWVNLTPSVDRKNSWELDNTDLQIYFTEEFKKNFWSKWFTIWARVWRRWPGWWDPVWIFLTTTNADNYNLLIKLSDDFKKFLESKIEVSQVNLTSSKPIWEIEFIVDSKKAALLGLNEETVFNSISTAIRWKTVWSIKWESNDHDIKLYIDTFFENVTPSDIENINIYSWWKTIKAGSVIDYKITKTSPSIKRSSWDIQVGISASLVESNYTTSIQSSLEEFAKKYEFPKWISYKKWWENEANSDLINSVLTWVFVAFFLIFAVLVYQFNSYGQPVVILYSVFMSLIWVTIWLYVTGNPLSMPVGIWFISLMWIVVNDAIVMVDKINKNLHKWMELKLSITEWAISRLNPILVTTVTTIAWILPIALQDVFWAWLWFTIAFGLATGSFMTLYAIPALYYSLESRKYKNSQNREYIEKIEKKELERKSWIKISIFKKIFNKKNIKFFAIFFIIIIIAFFATRWLNPVKKNATMTPEVKQVLQKMRSWVELSESEKKTLNEFKEKNKSSGSRRGRGK